MLKKVLLILLAVAMVIVTGPTSSVVQAKTVDKDYAYKVINALGIMDTDVNKKAELNDLVTRAEFAQMLVNMTTYKDTVKASSGLSMFTDVTKKYKGSGYIEFAVTHNLMSGYMNGSFKPKKTVTLQDAVNAMITLLGYSGSDFTNNTNDAKMALYYSKNLDDNVTKKKNQNLTRSDCANLFYNTLKAKMKDNTVYAITLGYTIDSKGEIDYLNVVDNEMDGPVIADINWSNKIPFSVDEATFYRNDSVSSKNSIEKYDVLYYSKNLKTVWAYSDKVTGVLKTISPNRLNPTQITLSGNTYNLGTKEMIYKFSTLGSLDIGDVITVLLGKDNTIVGVLGNEEYSATVNGVVLDTKETVNTTKNDSIYRTASATILDAYGREVTVEYNGETDDYVKKDVVQVSYENGNAKIQSIANRQLSDPISGVVNDTGTKMGSYNIAKDAKILDLKDNKYINIKPSRLAGALLYQSDILYYSFNYNTEINEMILDDVTGDLYDYGVLLDFDLNVVANVQQATYKYQIEDTENTVTSTDFTDSMIEFPCQFSFVDNKLDNITKLTRIVISSIDGLKVMEGSDVYTMSDEADVYYLNDEKYYKTTLKSVNDFSKYNLYGYYDKKMSLGGRVRIIVATDK